MIAAPKHLQPVIDAQTAANSLPSADEQQALQALGPLLRALVSSVTEGLVLELDGGHGMLTAWLQDGLHYDIPLVVIDPDSARLARTEANLYPDLRMAFHAQSGGAFLSDMEDKRFDLIVDHRHHDDQERFAVLVDRLANGGMAITRPSPALLASLSDSRAPNLARIRWSALPGGWHMAVLGPQIPARRGGRSGRMAARQNQGEPSLAAQGS